MNCHERFFLLNCFEMQHNVGTFLPFQNIRGFLYLIVKSRKKNVITRLDITSFLCKKIANVSDGLKKH